MSLGAHDDGSRKTYEDFADAIDRWSVAPSADLAEMFGRVALSILVNNVDDHWRNHGLLHDENGWRLSPLFDVNPSRQRGVIDSRAVNDSDDPSHRQLSNLLTSASVFRLSAASARGVLRRVATAVSNWDVVAGDLGIAATERAAYESSFDADQREWALALD